MKTNLSEVTDEQARDIAANIIKLALDDALNNNPLSDFEREARRLENKASALRFFSCTWFLKLCDHVNINPKVFIDTIKIKIEKQRQGLS